MVIIVTDFLVPYQLFIPRGRANTAMVCNPCFPRFPSPAFSGRRVLSVSTRGNLVVLSFHSVSCSIEWKLYRLIKQWWLSISHLYSVNIGAVYSLNTSMSRRQLGACLRKDCTNLLSLVISLAKLKFSRNMKIFKFIHKFVYVTILCICKVYHIDLKFFIHCFLFIFDTGFL